MSCIFCHSLESSHSEEPATSVVDSMEESSTACWDSDSDVSVSDTDSVCVPTPELWGVKNAKTYLLSLCSPLCIMWLVLHYVWTHYVVLCTLCSATHIM